MIDDTDPFIELPLHYGEGTAVYVRRSQVVMLEPAERHSDSPGTPHLRGTEVWFRLVNFTTSRFIPLSPQEVMARLDRSE